MFRRGQVVVVGGASWNSLIYVDAYPTAPPPRSGRGAGTKRSGRPGLEVPLPIALRMGARAAALAVGSPDLASPQLSADRLLELQDPEA